MTTEPTPDRPEPRIFTPDQKRRIAAGLRQKSRKHRGKIASAFIAGAEIIEASAKEDEAQAP